MNGDLLQSWRIAVHVGVRDTIADKVGATATRNRFLEVRGIGDTFIIVDSVISILVCSFVSLFVFAANASRNWA